MDDFLARFSQLAEMVSGGLAHPRTGSTSWSAGDEHVTAPNLLYRVFDCSGIGMNRADSLGMLWKPQFKKGRRRVQHEHCTQ